MSPKAASPSCSDQSVRAASAALETFLDRLVELARPETLESLAATEVSFSQLRILCVLACHDEPLPVNAIADQVQLSLAAAGRTIDKLVGSGFADRREDPADRRVKRISLTAEGTRYLETHMAVKHQTVRRFVAALPADLRDNLCAAVRPIIDDDVDHFCLSTESGSRAV